MKTPIPRQTPIDARVAQLERAVAALVEMASPEQFRKALAASSARNALADLAQAVAAGVLVKSTQVGESSIAVRFREDRGDEQVTPAVVLQLGGLDAATRAAFEGKSIGQTLVEKDGVFAVLTEVWNRATPARTHRPKGRHARR